jgi:hypothetical protein
MKYATKMASGGVTHIPSFMTTGSSNQVTFRVLSQQLERL